MGRKKNKRKVKSEASPLPVQSPELTKKKSGNKLWWVFGIVFCTALGFTFYWLLNADFRTERSKHKIDPAKEELPPEEKRVTFEDGLSEFLPNLKAYFRETLTPELVEELENAKSLAEAVIIVFKDIDPDIGPKVNKFVSQSVQDILTSLHTESKKPFKDLTAREKLSAIGTYLVEHLNFKYASGEGDLKALNMTPRGDGVITIQSRGSETDIPEPYLLSSLLDTADGNCATLPLAFTLVAQGLNLPVKLVTVRDHQFCRYQGPEGRINVEATSPEAMGIGEKDTRYERDFGVTPAMKLVSTTMKSMNLRQTISSLYVAKTAYLANSGSSRFKVKEAISMSAFFDKNSIYGMHNLYYEVLGGRNPESEKTPLMQEVEFLGFLTDSIRSPANHGRVKALEERINTAFGDAKAVLNKVRGFPKEIKTFKKLSNQLAQMFYRLDPQMYPGKINHGVNTFNHPVNLLIDPLGRGSLNLDPNFNQYSKSEKKRVIKQKVQELRSNVQIKEINLRSEIGEVENKVKDLLENASFLTRLTHTRLLAIQNQNKKLLRNLQTEGSQIYSIANDLH